MSPDPQPRTLHLHAGPHKTASTYLQARLQANRRALQRQGLRYPLPWGEHSHRQLGRSLQAGRWQALEQLLQHHSRWSGDLLLSAEHFTPLLSDPAAIEALRRCCARHGLALHVLNVVRPQAELLNSFYAHVLGRLYATPTFAAYVKAQLAGTRLRGPARRRWIRVAPLQLDLEQRFAPLLAAAALRCSFLPFVPRRRDLFEQLVEAVGLAPAIWRPAPAHQANEQLGRRGLALAYRLNQRLDQLPLRRNRLIAEHGLNRLVEQLRQRARQRGWVQERYSGWCGQLPARLEQRYGAANRRFAERVWGQSWDHWFEPMPVGPALAAAAALPCDGALEAEAEQLFTAYRRRLPRNLR
jgi:hypothetical protein